MRTSVLVDIRTEDNLVALIDWMDESPIIESYEILDTSEEREVK